MRLKILVLETIFASVLSQKDEGSYCDYFVVIRCTWGYPSNLRCKQLPQYEKGNNQCTFFSLTVLKVSVFFSRLKFRGTCWFIYKLGQVKSFHWLLRLITQQNNVENKFARQWLTDKWLWLDVISVCACGLNWVLGRHIALWIFTFINANLLKIRLLLFVSWLSDHDRVLHISQ